MDILYLIFAAIPIGTLALAFFSELTGRREAIPVGGVEYNVYLPKTWLMIGGFGIFAFGVLFLLAFENAKSPLFNVLPIFAVLFAALAGEIAALCAVVFYFGYRLTVRGGVIFYKLPMRRELIVPISQIDSYSVAEKKNGKLSLRIFSGKRSIFAQGQGTELLLCELESRNIRKK